MDNVKRSSRSQGGFTLIEFGIVLAIIAIAAIIFLPRISAMMIDTKVTPTANDINKTVSKMRNNFAGQGTTPYGSVNTAGFAQLGRGLFSAIAVNGVGATATMAHDLGETGASVVVSSATITTAGDSFAVQLNKVNEAACPSLANQLSRAADVISINGTSVKASGAAYNGATAGTACTAGDTNTYVFTFR